MMVRVAQIQFRSLRHRHFAELRIGNEAVAIGHLHLWQRLLVELAVRRQNSVQAQDVRRERVVIVDAERSRRLVGHRTMYVVEQRGGVGPEASDRLDRLIGSERALTADQAILDAALAVVAMAGRAVLRENLLTVPHRATAVGQALAVGLDVDVPQLYFVRARGTSEIEGVSRKYEGSGSYRTRKELLRLRALRTLPSPSMLQV